MARYKPYDYDQMQMVSVSLAEQLVVGTLEYAIHHIIEDQIDTSFFDDRYSNDETGSRAIDPKVLLKIVLFGYSRGLTSSRPLERSCRENIMFMALSCGQSPDHSTIAAFVSSLGEQIVPLFTQVLLICEENDLLGGSHFSLDGLKLPSNASKEWSGKLTDLDKKKKNLERKVKEAVREHRSQDESSGKKALHAEKNRREKRIRKLKNGVKRIEKFLARNGPRIGSCRKEIQSNVTDNESAKMATSHGVVQGYNANAMVDEDNQIIVHADVFGDGTDGKNLRSMLEGAKENFQDIGHDPDVLKDKIISADTGYFSKENLKACKDEEVDAYIPDPQFRKRDIRFADADRHRRSIDKHHQKYKSKKRWFSVEDFTFDDDTGKLMCPAGKSLYRSGKNFETANGYIVTAYKGTKRACSNCHLRSKCIRKPTTPIRQVRIFHGRHPGSITDEMKQKIDTPEGRKTYSKRLGIVEPVFANIRSQKRMDRFTLSGRSKVKIQWMLYCIVHNMEKIAHFGKSYAPAV